MVLLDVVVRRDVRRLHRAGIQRFLARLDELLFKDVDELLDVDC